MPGGAELARARPYAERAEEAPGWHDRIAEALVRMSVTPIRERINNSRRQLKRIVDLTNQHARTFEGASDADLLSSLQPLRLRLQKSGFERDTVAECFALVREAAQRTIGYRHYASQLMAGYALIEGKMVEMATGEGKTFAATLPACVVALAGFPVHIITVNDYLASRDAEKMGPLYRFLGLTVGTVIQGMPKDARREAYAKSITYCTNKELAFDYLRDRVALGGRGSRLHLALQRLHSGQEAESELVLRGLYFCIVDEADSVFIDEARTPLILSASLPASAESGECHLALEFAKSLADGEDFAVDLQNRRIFLKEPGKARLEELSASMEGLWTSKRAREELLVQALSAMLLYRRDHHYVVTEGKVQIVDESTGRIMPDRSWERGLHQLIEAKEGCALSDRRETLARLTYQRLFRRYVRLSGMSGTATEVTREINSVYRLEVTKIPLNKPSRRRQLRSTICATRTEKWHRVANVVQRLAGGEGRPVLIGTRSVKASEEISSLLTERGVVHALLNAKQDQSEADVISQAGQRACVTVATNIAGRGTDIHLGPGVAELGGLHVILTEYHESSRVDRQLFGRCARQGDPGSCEAIVSLEDEIFTLCAPVSTNLLVRLRQRGVHLPDFIYQALKLLAQFTAEQRNSAARTQNLKHDRRLNEVLAFSGRGE